MSDERLERYSALLAACDHLSETELRRLIQLALRMPDMSDAEQRQLLERAESGTD